ncbi:hypothetical protein V6N13_051368 [Hibiscus sabdariffa]
MEPFPLQPSKFSFEYLLLPPRSTPTAAPPGLTPRVLRRPSRPPTHRGLALAPTAGYRILPTSFLAPYGFSNQLTRTHVRLLGLCFKTGRMGSPQADARSTLVPKHAETTRAGFHNRGDDVSTGVSKAQTWAASTICIGPRPEPIGGPALATTPRGATGSGHDGALTLSGATFQGTWARSAAEDASPDYNSDAKGDRFSSWTIPGSLDVTKGILDWVICAPAAFLGCGSRFSGSLSGIEP